MDQMSSEEGARKEARDWPGEGCSGGVGGGAGCGDVGEDGGHGEEEEGVALVQSIVSTPPSSSPPLSQVFVFDFQSKDPENIYVALAALSGQPVPGAILERKISRVPRNRCWLVGSSSSAALEEAREFNRIWETDMRIGHHDCRDYVNG